MARKDPRVDAYITAAQPFARPILKRIRTAVHAGCPECAEDIKWRHPAFIYKGILCFMAAFTRHASFGFWDGMVARGGEPDSAWGQFGRLTSTADLPSEKALAAMVREAVKLKDTGVKPTRDKMARRGVKPRQAPAMPADFAGALRKHGVARETFDAFSPSHRREYIEWITEAKREETRARRIATAVAWLSEGKSRNWKYDRGR